MSPKSLLRHPMAVSGPDEFTSGAFREVIADEADASKVKRLILCSGKVYYDLIQTMESEGTDDLAIVRLEQLYPFPGKAIRAEIEKYDPSVEIIWLQEEPRNMGGWMFARDRIDAILEEMTGDCTRRIRYAGRPAMASPATGSTHVHQREQESIIQKAMRG
jgi:2-oxoglutarate dehydrogenase E1 component